MTSGHGILIALLVSIIVLASFIPAPRDKISFLDIGQGDSILLQSGTAQVLIDGGPGTTVLERLAEELPFFDRTLDVIIATHPDQDHLEGLVHVLDRYDVSLVILPPEPHTTDLQAEWVRRLKEEVMARNVQYRFAAAGQQLQLGEARISILGPLATDGILAKVKTNNAAVLTRVDFHELSLLLTADAETSVEQALIAREAEKLDVAVLKAGHHGSKTSTGEALLTATTPQLAIISVGSKNRYGHPHPLTVSRIERRDIPILRTDERGTIRFIAKGNKWFVSCGQAALFTQRNESCMKTSS